MKNLIGGAAQGRGKQEQRTLQALCKAWVRQLGWHKLTVKENLATTIDGPKG